MLLVFYYNIKKVHQKVASIDELKYALLATWENLSVKKCAIIKASKNDWKLAILNVNYYFWHSIIYKWHSRICFCKYTND